MGILQKARYLGSSSGGSWFNAAFSYTQVRVEGLVEALNMRLLGSVGG
jgi:hypothetical protein